MLKRSSIFEFGEGLMIPSTKSLPLTVFPFDRKKSDRKIVPEISVKFVPDEKKKFLQV